MKYICILILLVITVPHRLFAQSASTYSPLKDDITVIKSLADKVTQRYNADIASLSGGNKKYISEIYKDRYDDIEKKITDNVVVTASYANNYLQTMLKKIIQCNPQLSSTPVQVVFVRDYWPNASCTGEGTIFFNIGLFNRLENENQVCFVVCHELAHQYLNHVNNAIEKYVNTVNSKEFQDELKKIKNSEYEKKQQLEGLVKTFQFDSRRHSRDNESQADSFAVELMKNTPFDVHASLSCLALLDSVDNDKYNIPIPLETIFNFNQYPFKKSWIEEEQSFFSQMAKANDKKNENEKDSLKTHPDCKVRIGLLTNMVNDYGKIQKVVTDSNSSSFDSLKHIFDYEIIEYCFNSGNVSRSFYYTLQMLQFFPEDKYLQANVIRCLNKIYESQKAHTFGKVVESPTAFTEEKYNSFLQFLGRLRLTEIAALSYYYAMQKMSSLSDYPLFKEQQKISEINFKQSS